MQLFEVFVLRFLILIKMPRIQGIRIETAAYIVEEQFFAADLGNRNHGIACVRLNGNSNAGNILPLR